MRTCSPRRSYGSRHQRGWAASEYLSVLLGLVVVWKSTSIVLTLLREYHDEFAWALTIPF